MDKFGFPRTGSKTAKRIQDFQTGDRARLYMSKGKYAGHHVGRIAGVRATGILDLKTTTHKISASAQRFSLIQKFDGYDYQWRRGR